MGSGWVCQARSASDFDGAWGLRWHLGYENLCAPTPPTPSYPTPMYVCSVEAARPHPVTAALSSAQLGSRSPRNATDRQEVSAQSHTHQHFWFDTPVFFSSFSSLVFFFFTFFTFGDNSTILPPTLSSLWALSTPYSPKQCENSLSTL